MARKLDKKLSVRLPSVALAALKKLSDIHGISISQVLRTCFYNGFKKTAASLSGSTQENEEVVRLRHRVKQLEAELLKVRQERLQSLVRANQYVENILTRGWSRQIRR